VRKWLRRRLAEALYGVAMALNGRMVPPLCETCALLTVRIGTGASRPERRRAAKEAWRVGGKGK
jgi:hypothetical protein